MKAVRFHGKEDLRFENVPVPKCGRGQIKVKPVRGVDPHPHPYPQFELSLAM